MGNFDINILLKAKDDTGGAITSAKQKIQSLQSATADMEAKQRRLTAVVGGLNGAMSGNLSALNSLTGGFGKLGNAVATGGLLISAAFASWKIGLKVQEQLWKHLVGSIKDGSIEAAESIKALSDSLAKGFSGAIEQAGKKIVAVGQASKEAAAEAARSDALASRRTKAVAILEGTDAPAADQANAKRSEQTAASEVERLKADADAIGKLIEEATAKADAAREKYLSTSGATGEMMRAFREESAAAIKAAEDAKVAGAKQIKEINDQIAEQEQRILDAKVASKQAEEAKAKAEQDAISKRIQLETQAQANAKAIADAEFAKGAAADQQNIEMQQQRINDAKERLEDIAMNKQERKAQRLADRAEKRDERKFDQLVAKRDRGIKLSKDAEAFLQAKLIEKQIAEDEKQKAKDEKEARERAEARAQQTADDQLKELRNTNDKLTTLLQAAGG